MESCGRLIFAFNCCLKLVEFEWTELKPTKFCQFCQTLFEQTLCSEIRLSVSFEFVISKFDFFHLFKVFFVGLLLRLHQN